MHRSFKRCVLIAGLAIVGCNEPSDAGNSATAGPAGSSSAPGGAGASAAGSGVAGSVGIAPSKTASATLTPIGSASGLSGIATFSKLTYGIKLMITVTNCSEGKSYPVHIHDGASCADAASQGGHWGTAADTAANGGTPAAATPVLRGEGIPDIVCAGNTGTSTHTRSTPDARAVWTMGAGTTTDVVGHVVVVHDGDVPVACGLIVAQ